jgi:hypothetical protein
MSGDEILFKEGTPAKPGVRTSEFWLSLACIGAGLVLVALNRDVMGEWLIGLAVSGYAVSRGIAKR